jgi:hypothetical protein
VGAVTTVIPVELPNEIDNMLYVLRKEKGMSKKAICKEILMVGIKKRYAEYLKIEDQKKAGGNR